MNGHFKGRKGIREHTKQGKFRLAEFGLYWHLHGEADWTSGIAMFTAQETASDFGESDRNVRRYMESLRKKGYINYSAPKGKRSRYSVLINKYEPTAGVHVGKRLNAFAENGLQAPVYEEIGLGVRQVSGMCPSSVRHVSTYKEVRHQEERIKDNSRPGEEQNEMMFSETKEKISSLIESWNNLPDVKKYNAPKKYINGEFPPSSVFACLVDYVSSSDWEAEWQAVLDEYKNSAFLRSGGKMGNVNSITWIFQAEGKNRELVLAGKYRDAEKQSQFFLDKDNLSEKGELTEAAKQTIEELKANWGKRK